MSRPLKSLTRQIERKIEWRVKRLLMGHRVQTCRTIEYHGGERDCYAVCPDGLGEASVVYSFGIGRDIQFELSLIRKYGCTIHAFDPTPDAVAWAREQNPPPELKIGELGLADRDGTVHFGPIREDRSGNYTLLERADELTDAFDAQVRRLSTLTAERGHNHVDLLKMDIEGAEYGVLRDILGSNIPVGQLLLEFHHFFADVGREKTREAVQALNSHGYRIFHISENGREYSFIRE
jgi:FkbM family methyltransferase